METCFRKRKKVAPFDEDVKGTHRPERAGTPGTGRPL